MLLILKSLITYVLIPPSGVLAACLPNASTQKRQIVVGGVQMPLGIWPMAWDTAMLVAHVMRIVAEDLLGLDVALGPGDHRAGISVTSIKALAGCRVSEDEVEDCLGDPSKDAADLRYHLAFETWSAESYWEEWQRSQPERSPVQLGPIGYSGSVGSYIKSTTVSAGISRNGLSLLFYGNYNASWFDPSTQFDDINNIDTVSLSKCSDMMSSSLDYYISLYDKFFGSDRGLGYEVKSDGSFSLNCRDDLWWLSPACRSNTGECIPYISNQYAHGVDEIMMKSSYYNLPFAFGFARDHEQHANILSQNNVVLYAWQPDTVTATSNLQQILFPAFNATLSEQGFEITMKEDKPLQKWAAQGLEQSALRAYEVARRMSIPLEDINKMLSNFSAGGTYYDAACGWLRNSPDWRRNWIQWCAPGYFRPHYARPKDASGSSEQGIDCQPCPLGQFRNDIRSDLCSECPLGSFSSIVGSTSCNSCPKGTYASSPGAQACESCSWWYTTASEGAVGTMDCMLNPSVVVALFIMTLLSVPVSVGFLVHRHHKKDQHRIQMEKVLSKGFEATAELQHPMCLIKLEDFQEMSLATIQECHEGARIAGKVAFLDTLTDVESFRESGRKIMFFSYTWLSWNRLGPDAVQLACMKQSALKVCELNAEDVSNMYIWLDVLSIPQVNPRCKALAVDSLFNYASRTDYLIAICPDGQHEETKEPAGAESYKSRVWCRVEQVAHCSTKGLRGMYRTQGPDHLVPMEEGWIRDIIHIFDAHTTCCRLGHPGQRKCDRELLVPTLLAMYAKMYQDMRQQERSSASFQNFWFLIQENRDRVFPQMFTYRTVDGKHETRPLFGPLMSWISQLCKNSDDLSDMRDLFKTASASVQAGGIMTAGSLTDHGRTHKKMKLESE
eukprot:TRINITY_DN74421_c0_g1_i1.p1 TRINITY_DN74421_c0_g1~~TRINITY_DN74421_c0_g1_i1.p1  ORF type:complete len:897 (+),score=70.36 TRINITY_DN74421_c0_g1_i1:39-2729(+)